MNRIAVTLDDTEHCERALELLDKALDRTPQNVEVNYNKSLWLLSSGRLEEGWKQWEWRLKLKTAKAQYGWFPVQQWNGQDLTGKHVFVWMEQGIGDQILTASMLPDLISIAASVTVHCYARLVPLFRRSFPTITVLKLGEPVPERVKNWDFNYQMSVSDLGRAFRKNFSDFPKHDGYLKADPKLTAKLKAKYGDGHLTGISWRSSNYLIGGGKSMKIENMGHILTAPGAKFINLQYGDCAAEIAEAKQRFGVDIINDPEIDQLTNMDTFASQVKAMDQVISTSNSVLHLAGALGVPSIGFIPRGASRIWYWFADRPDSPFYPSIEIMRQQRLVPQTYTIESPDLQLNAKFSPDHSPEGSMYITQSNAVLQGANV